MWEENDFSTLDVPCLDSCFSPCNNQVYTMYHGTSRAAAQSILVEGFRQSPNGMLGCGVYLSRDLQKASRYPLHLPEHQRVVLRVRVNVGKVKKIDYQGHPLQKTWHNHGYDTAWCPPGCGMVQSGLEEDCVWDPRRIILDSIIYPKNYIMWAEDDLGPGVPCLQSYTEPVDGKIYLMYHGTSRFAAQQIMACGFRPSADGMLGPGVYLSRDLNKASRYPLRLPAHEKVVLRVRVNVGRVTTINYQYHPMQKTWHYHGYDTAWRPPSCGMVPCSLQEVCVWVPSRIQVTDVVYPRIEYVIPHNLSSVTSLDFIMWAEDDLGPGVPCLQSYTEPVDGKIYIMYHGTSRFAAQQIMAYGFRPSKNGMLGPGVYLSRDLNKASRYPLNLPEHEKVVLRVWANVGRVKKIDYQGHPLQKTWHCHGYNTAWCPPLCGMVPSGLEEDCVWDPSRIQIIDAIYPKLQYVSNDCSFLYPSLDFIMWAEDDLGPGVPCLQSYTEPVDGKIYRMYHGTSRYAAQQIMASGFKQSANGMLGPGVYLSRDLNKASRYPLNLPEHERVVLRVWVNVGRVKKIDYQGHPLQKTWHYHGYDTAWCPPLCGMVPSGLEEDCVWDPSRIQVIDSIYPKPVAFGGYYEDRY
ncbi:LOW QUALITY PROTEIN: grass carp reovirus (GCRV)-induced gene 2e [Colossoma macropomum]|uniref:LOW QUALITY PROTEIN: grass carp reovirus (GCRV)-induced gene 2e n=1 Tax=Colossoma macropomum TaxID=42526 RepID=UPI00186494C9|nr:LOW QUALITY PROTEIN: grass carp reovirus (GCRV)-induced gene 2e [Colossoma macropomum]